ncbi:MAG: ankyrin repeat domain-containing protein, partial [Gammaproteobacteria bacterium]|nr:ankyrin repeat domain-containing protein [Gammaproteobacteria bacterium]
GQGPRLLHQAVLGGRIENVKWLVEVGCDLGIRDDVHGSTPLQWSIALGRDECRDFLSQFDLDLFDSILCDRSDRIQKLVQSDSGVLERTLKEVRDSQYTFEDDWMTPLVFALTRERVEASKCLLDLGANRQIEMPSGESLDEYITRKAPKTIVEIWSMGSRSPPA